jgi:hypothetical protein
VSDRHRSIRSGSPEVKLRSVLGFERLRSGWASETRQVVGDLDPWSAAIEVDVELRCPINRVIDVRERNIDLVGMVLGFAEEGAPAAPTKGPTAVRGGGVATELVAPRFDFQLSSWNGKPGHKAGPVVPATHGAMAMQTEEGGKAHSEAYSPAKARTRNG